MQDHGEDEGGADRDGSPTLTPKTEAKQNGSKGRTTVWRLKVSTTAWASYSQS